MIVVNILLDQSVEEILHRGAVIPAHPLALDAQRRLDERRQRALTRYYLEAGAGGIAVGVHTTQFAIRDPRVGLYEPVLSLAIDEVRLSGRAVVKVAGVSGEWAQVVAEAELARDLGYDLVLLSQHGLGHWSEGDLLRRVRLVGEIMPVFGFYLQPAVGGRVLSRAFWEEFAGLETVSAIKIAPFNRYQTLDVISAVCRSGRADDIALYTGNDDNIVADLLTTYRIRTDQGMVTKHIVGGLLGHWAVWTHAAVQQLELIRQVRAAADGHDDLLTLSVEITDANAAFFDAANGFRGCIAGLHEVLRRQGLLQGTWCLDPEEQLSPGQLEQIDRVYQDYPHLNDDAFVSRYRDRWLSH